MLKDRTRENAEALNNKQDFKNKSDAELNAEEKALRQEIFDLRYKMATAVKKADASQETQYLEASKKLRVVKRRLAGLKIERQERGKNR